MESLLLHWTSKCLLLVRVAAPSCLVVDRPTTVQSSWPAERTSKRIDVVWILVLLTLMVVSARLTLIYVLNRLGYLAGFALCTFRTMPRFVKG